MGRFDALHEIQRLDPERDNQRIMHLSFGYEFPWNSVRALSYDDMAIHGYFSIANDDCLFVLIDAFCWRKLSPCR